MLTSDRKRFPTCVIFKCDFCSIKYPINHNFVLLGIYSIELLHICPNCWEENGVDIQGEDVMFIPTMDYTTPLSC